MKVTIDPEADALYMRLSDKRIKDTEEVKPGIIPDYDDKNNLVGIEIPPRIQAGAGINPEIGAYRIGMRMHGTGTVPVIQYAGLVYLHSGQAICLFTY